MGLGFVEAVVVAEDRPGADVGLLAHRSVAQIGQVVGLGAPAHLDLLDLDEVADVGLLADVRARPQPRVGSDDGARTHDRPFQMAEGADHRAGLDLHPRAEDHIGLDHRPAGDACVPREVDRVRRCHADALGHQRRAAAGLEDRFRRGQLGLGVDPHHRVLGCEGGAHGQPVGIGQADDIGEVVLALAVLVVHAREEPEQHRRGRGDHIGVAGVDGELIRQGVLGLDDPRKLVSLEHHPAVEAWVGGLERQHR